MPASNDELAAREWLAKWLDRHHIKWDALTQAEQFLLMREIPCSIRCWRVGVSIDVKPCEICPECGKTEPKLTFWEQLPLPV